MFRIFGSTTPAKTAAEKQAAANDKKLGMF
jgi:hypothetical protein